MGIKETPKEFISNFKKTVFVLQIGTVCRCPARNQMIERRKMCRGEKGINY